MISFTKDAGVELPASTASGAADGVALTRAIEAHLQNLGLKATHLAVSFQPATAQLTVTGFASHQDLRERIVLCCGNVRGVAAVDDQMTVDMPADASRWRLVAPGETLARIAQDLYRDSARAPHLLAANQPLIDDAEALQPGWLLRVPV